MMLSEIPIEKLRKTPYFHLVDSAKLESITDYAAWLEAILHNACSVYEENGELFLIETKQLVARLDGLKIEIYANEHPPPHFHVKSPNVNASFDIENCTLLEGSVNKKDLKKIQFWHKHAKLILVEIWNSRRPTSCPVGKFLGV